MSMSLAGFVTITRPTNTLAAGLAAVVAYLIATGRIVPAVLLLFVIVALITAAGNVINDYFDAAIDAINRPDRPIPAGKVTRMGARSFSVVLFLAGILVSLFTNQLCIAIAVINSLLLVAYAAKLKSMPFVGNAAVSYLAASMFLFGGALDGMAGLVHVLPIAVITFFAMLSRELVKDAEDVEGDAAGGASTLPIIIGVKKTARLAFVFAILAVVTSFFPYTWWGFLYIAGIIPVDIIILIAAARAISRDSPAGIRDSGAALLLKIGFFASLIVFTLSAIFLTPV
jgi:geranylgeranylglycerol-phosphate geranylgeranyltransferase